MKKIIYFIAVIAVLAVIVVILIGNKKSTQKKTELASFVSTAVSVQMEMVKEASYNMNFSSNGSLEPIRELAFVSDVSGRVVDIRADEGTSVSKGTVLIQVDDDMLKADFNAAESAYNALKVDLERFTNANSQGGISNQQLDNMRTQLVGAESRYITSKRRLADATIKSPIAGVINKRYVEVGAYLNPGARLFDLIDDSQLRIWCNVTENQVLLLKKGDNVRIGCNTFPDSTFTGMITFVGQKADRSLNFPVEITINQRNKAQLKAGMYVTTYFDMQSEKQGILIPRSAISGSVKTANVFLVKNGIVSKREVVVGTMIEKNVEILKGLQAGDSIVVAGLINISEGTKVQNVKF
jgi:RND family efflux transporter MFP subunit